MDIKLVFIFVWGLLNTPAGIALIAGGVLYGLNKLYASKPAWAKFEGAIITAIKLAEKQVPDDTESKGLAKLDHALKYVLKVYTETTGKRASVKMEAELKEGIQLTHEKFDAENRTYG